MAPVSYDCYSMLPVHEAPADVFSDAWNHHCSSLHDAFVDCGALPPLAAGQRAAEQGLTLLYPMLAGLASKGTASAAWPWG